MIDERLAKALEARGLLWSAYGRFWHRAKDRIGVHRIIQEDFDFLDRFILESLPLVMAMGAHNLEVEMYEMYGWSRSQEWFQEVGLVYLAIRLEVGL